MTLLLLVFIWTTEEVLAQDRGFLGAKRSKPNRPLAPQLKAGTTSPKSKAHKKRYRNRGTQPPKLARKGRDSRRLHSPRDEPSRASRYAGAGNQGPPPRKGVRDDRQFIPASPKGDSGDKNFGKFASSGPAPRKGLRDGRKYYPTTPKSKASKRNFGGLASPGPGVQKGVRDSRKFYPASPDTKVDTKNFGRFASSGPTPRKGVPDSRKYYPTTPKSKASKRNFGRFASSGPTPRKGVRDSRKYFPTTPTFKPDNRNFGQYARLGPQDRRRVKDQRPRKIAGRYQRAPASDGAIFNKQKYVANVHGFDSPGALWRGNMKGKQKPPRVGYHKGRFLEGAYFNTPMPSKGAGRLAGLSANYQGNLTRRPGSAKYSKEMANYTGHQGDLLRYRIRMTRQPATYAGGERTFKRSTGINISGLLTFKRANKIYPRKDIAKYGGNSYKKTPNYQKTSGAYSQGNVLVKDRYRRRWFESTKSTILTYLNPSREPAYYTGRYKLSRPAKGAHPTAIYARNIKRHKSAEGKETNRRRNLWINRLFVFRGKDQPDDFKKPVKKPKYDRKEHQIWND